MSVELLQNKIVHEYTAKMVNSMLQTAQVTDHRHTFWPTLPSSGKLLGMLHVGNVETCLHEDGNVGTKEKTVWLMYCLGNIIQSVVHGDKSAL